MPDDNERRQTGRRKFLTKASLGAVTLASVGSITGVGRATAKNPKDLHPDDKIKVGDSQYTDHWQEVVQKSQGLNVEKGGEDVLIYVNEEYVREHILEGKHPDKTDKSLSQLVAESEYGKKAKKAHKKAVRKANEELEKSASSYESASGEVSTQALDTVTLGTNTTFYSNEQGDAGEGGFWGNKQGEVRPSVDQLHCETFVSPGAIGDAWSWAWTGNEFQVNGSGSDTATIVADVDYSGTSWSALAASAELKLTFVMRHITDGFTQEVVLKKGRADNNVIEEVDIVGNVRKAITTTLAAGKRYRPEVHLRATCSVGFEGGATADMGENLDSNSLPEEFADSRWFEVKF